MGLQDTRIEYYALFYVDSEAQSHVNLSKVHDPIDAYLQCAATLALSLHAAKATLTVLTNSPDRLQQRLSSFGLAGVFKVVGLPFRRTVPTGIPFYSAHFKLDLFRYFAENLSPLVCLLDIDTVMLKPINLPAEACNSLIAYDITEQHGASYQAGTLSRDIGFLSTKPTKTSKWYGGEFLLGRPGHYALLADKIDRLWPRYCEHLTRLHHVGDEMIVSAALFELHSDGLAIMDAGRLKLVHRWWSARTECVQSSFSEAAEASIIHLPSDKVFLASQAKHSFDRTKFLQTYRRYVRGKLLVRRLANPVLNVATGARKFVGKI
ncbi:hypothetical protein [Bradyrhizobium sp. 15]|uniref:hypothetical protein n=1 Tax=Bradyrhizobium sp. 15 TaxID=2782633 RepID=UPI001FF71F81|nr:hypothetical protein [Bradyrhizobium sp. 15]MCK1434939.1 hypothetical protein [Bradyrhizobium sp. 15]